MEEPSGAPGHLVLCPPDDFWSTVPANGIVEMRRDGQRVVLEIVDDPAVAWPATSDGVLAEWLIELGRGHGRPMLRSSDARGDTDEEYGADDWIIDDETVVMELLATHRDTMRGAAPPLSDVVAAAGCRWESPWMAGPSVTADSFRLYALGRGVIDRFGHGDADDEAAEMVGTAILVFGRWRAMVATDDTTTTDTSIEELLDMSALLLGESPVIAGVLGDYPGAADHPFAHFVMATVERCRALGQPLRPGLAWLAARLLITDREPSEALDILRSGERPPAVLRSHHGETRRSQRSVSLRVGTQVQALLRRAQHTRGARGPRRVVVVESAELLPLPPRRLHGVARPPYALNSRS